MGAWLTWVRRLGGPRPAPVPDHVVIPAPEATPARPPNLVVVTPAIPLEVFELSETFEAFRAEPYQDRGKGDGVWTIGYGSTLDAGNKPVTLTTPRITVAEARALKARDLQLAVERMRADFPSPLSPRWWAAGILLCNNLGRMSMWGKTLHRMLLAGHWVEAANQLRHYHNARDKHGVLVPMLGLRRRRWTEAAYALGMDPKLAYKRAWSEIHSPDDWPELPKPTAK